MTTLLDHKTTMAYLAYLGFERPVDAVKVVRRGRGGRRDVFLSYVFGAQGSGKVDLG